MDDANLDGEPLVILLVEDNPAHAELVIRSFEANKVANRLIHVSDGDEALDYLYRRGDYVEKSTSPRPHVILLDLRMPKVDGLEVLKTLKNDENLHTIPVVILTTSDADKDVAKAYDYHANSYLVKPVDFKKFTQLMQNLGYYWLGWNQQLGANE